MDAAESAFPAVHELVSAFDDSAWTSAPGGFSARGTPDGVICIHWPSSDVWRRREFSLASVDPK